MFVSGGDGGVDERLIKHTKIGRRFGLQRAVFTVKFIIAVARGLGSPEIRQQIVIPPACQPG